MIFNLNVLMRIQMSFNFKEIILQGNVALGSKICSLFLSGKTEQDHDIFDYLSKLGYYE